MDEQVPKPRTSLPVVVKPNPMRHQRAGTLGTIMSALGLTAAVAVVLYGLLSRPDMPQQTASAPTQTAQPAPAGNTGAQSQQAGKPEPSTTGQGQSSELEKQQPTPGKTERSDSATTGAKPGGQPKPQQ